MKTLKKQNPKQYSFWKKPPTDHGGSHRKGLRKIARPLATDRAVLVTLKSDRAHGPWNFLKQQRKVEETVQATAKRFGVRVYDLQNVGNHLHLLVKCTSRRRLQKFFCVLPQAIVFLVTKTRKGRPIGKFWNGLLVTRVIEWGKDWRNAQRYMLKNQIEALGVPRRHIDAIFALGKSGP